MNPYEILGLDIGASKQQIRGAYLALVRTYHPDRYQDPAQRQWADEKLKQINLAYEALQPKHSPAPQTDRPTQPNTCQYAAQLRFAQDALQRNDLGHARQILSHLPPESARWYYLMGIVQLRSGEQDAALRTLERATKLEPDNDEYRRAYQSLRASKRVYQRGQQQEGGFFSTLRRGWQAFRSR